jgi:ABC-2 type transport system permease protein
LSIAAKLYSFVLLDGIKVWTTYRTQVTMNALSFVIPVFTFYFVGSSLGQTILAGYGAYSYTSFIVVGLAFQPFLTTILSAISFNMRVWEVNGVIEYYVLTPTGLMRSAILGSLWPMLWSVGISFTILVIGEILGANFSDAGVFGVLAITVMLVISSIGLGLVAGGAILVSKAGNPVQFFTVFSSLLSGTVFPIAVLPFWLKDIANLIPLTWALEGIRMELIPGSGTAGLGEIFTILILFDVVSTVLGIAVFEASFRFARQRGTLSEY